MEINADQLMFEAIRNGLQAAVKDKLTGYQSPLDKLLTDAVAKHAPEFRALLEEGIGSCLNDGVFRESIAAAVRSSLAKVLIQRFGGEMEKQVNILKSDPTTRARITLAIEEIVKSKVET